MIEVDGSAGGGQLVRSALTLSMLTGDPVRIDEVRGDRATPGLKAQHLAVVETAAAVSNAEVEGAATGSETVTFEPGAPEGGRYRADIGTAGSITLLFDTFLPLAGRLDDPLRITATGGTDVKWSPPLDYYRRVKLPILRAGGLAAAVEPERRGFYPVGGGEATLRVWPSDPDPLALAAPGPVTGARVYSTASADLADADVAERQVDAAVAELADRGVEAVTARTTYGESASPGSVVVVRLDREGGVAGLDACGEQGVSAERVAAAAFEDFEAVADESVAVDEHLADQLAVFVAVAGGRVAVPRVSDHLASSLDLFEAFGYEVAVTEREGRIVLEKA